ncbi:MAG: DUF5009 domain-containing protein [Sandaracinaceae bacterium]|nr:DUF5009 domain-containing protein [Sandaracinaceae bacterium]
MVEPQQQEGRSRLTSIDVLRGVVVAGMVLVNSVSDEPEAPRWLLHVPPGVDGMTIADVVFPAFLCVVGLSIPLAMERQLEAGVSTRTVVLRVVARTLALLAMGVLMGGRAENTAPSPRLWAGAMFVCFIAAFSTSTSRAPRTAALLRILRGLGWTGMVVLALTHRGPAGEHLVLGPLFDPREREWLRHGWWDILGCIGWAYLAASTAYLALRARPLLLFGGVPLGVLAWVAEREGLFAPADGAQGAAAVALAPIVWLSSHVSLGRQLGIDAAITMAGCALGASLLRHSGATHARWSLAVVAGCAIAGALLAPGFGINKHAGTPSWALLSCAWTCVAWSFVYWGVELRRWRRGTTLLRLAGANALLAYFIHPLLEGVVDVAYGLTSFADDGARSASTVLVGAALMTAAVVILTASAARRGMRLRV